MAITQTSIDRFNHFRTAALLFAALTTAGLAQNSGPAQPPSAAKVSIMVTDTEPGTAGAFATNAAPAQWIDIKDCTSEMRATFFSGLRQLEAIVNNQINELEARRATTNNPSEIKKLDLAIQNIGNAQYFLTAMGDLLGKATPQTWDKQKVKVGLAWAMTQEAYAKVKVPATS